MQSRLTDSIARRFAAQPRRRLVRAGLLAALALLCTAATVPARADFHKIADFKQSTIKQYTHVPPNPGPPTTYTTTIAVPNAIPVGSLVVVAEFASLPDEGGLIGDSRGNTWYAAIGSGPPSAEPDPACVIYYSFLTTALQTGDIVTAGGGEVQLEGICAAAWSGATSLNQASGGSYTAPYAGSNYICQAPLVQDVANPELFISVIESTDSGTISAPSPWTALTNEPATGYLAYHMYTATGGSHGCPFTTVDEAPEYAACTAGFD